VRGLNEHVIGKRWPAVAERHQMLSEAIDVITTLFDEDGTVNHHGRHFKVDSARLWDRPDERVPVGVAVSGADSCRIAGAKADLMIATEPDAQLGELFDRAGGKNKPRVGQVALCYDADHGAAVARAHDQFRWFGLGWKVNADLPNPDSFAGATALIRPEQVAEQIPCGPDLEEHVRKVKAFVDAGFDEVALVQIGGDTQGAFLAWAEEELLPTLRDL
jgi:G6PDH family F420-dependent oxidoreductase